MPSPTGFTRVTTVSAGDDPITEALFGLQHLKYGGRAGAGASLSYSFPFVDGAAAEFRQPYGSHDELSGTSIGFNTEQRSAAALALARWANVAKFTFTPVADSATTVGDIRFAFSSRVDASDWGYTYEVSATPEASDIWIGLSKASETDWAPLGLNFFGLLHEIGHALGFKHPGDYENLGVTGGPYLSTEQDTLRGTVMSYALETYGTFAGQRVFPTAPMVLDIRAMQALYGANTQAATGDDRYAFDPDTPLAETLWDAGGVDTVDASAFSTDCRIDLRPGHYSSLRFLPGAAGDTYDGTDNLGIAFDCQIENAVGGSGNDVLVGNDGANDLDGGLGADSMAGGAGDDVYRVDTPDDVVTEDPDAGTDLLIAQLSFDLANTPNVEQLQLDGTATAGSGNALDNRLIGNGLGNLLEGSSGRDVLLGRGGSDTLTGGAGRDWFVFDTARRTSNADFVTDFRPGRDKLVLDDDIYGKLKGTQAGAALPADRFLTGARALDADDFLLFKPDTHELCYDSNGSAAGGAVLIATVQLVGGTTLRATDFLVIA